MWDANEKRGMLELRHKEILARIDILNQMSTQAMLIAGASVTGLGGESLQVVREEGLSEWGSRWDGVFGTLFVGSTAATLTSSLWVIFTSTHLIELSQQSALHGTDARDIKAADGILEERMREVRMFYVAALGSLLSSSLFMVWMSMSLVNSAVVTVIIVWGTAHAFITRAHTRQEFVERTHVELSDRRGDALSRLLCRACLLSGLLRWPPPRPFAPLYDEDEGEGGTAPLGSPRRKGWMAKTTSAGGPLRHVGSCQLGAGEIAEVMAPECRDRRYFTLIDGRLAWWRHEEERTLKMEPQTVLVVSDYAVLPVVDCQNQPALALVPKSILLALQQRPPPKKLELPSGAPKSWYLQAKTPAETLAWRKDLTLASEPPSQAAC